VGGLENNVEDSSLEENARCRTVSSLLDLLDSKKPMYYKPMHRTEQATLAVSLLTSEIRALEQSKVASRGTGRAPFDDISGDKRRDSPSCADTPAKALLQRQDYVGEVAIVRVVRSQIRIIPSKDREKAKQGAPLPRSPRAFARHRFTHDISAILTQYEAAPMTALARIIEDLAALSILSEKWSVTFVAETHADSVKRSAELRDAVTFSSIRHEIDEVAPELNEVFAGVKRACVENSLLTGRRRPVSRKSRGI
jgi:hypothetical protein